MKHDLLEQCMKQNSGQIRLSFPKILAVGPGWEHMNTGKRKRIFGGVKYVYK